MRIQPSSAPCPAPWKGWVGCRSETYNSIALLLLGKGGLQNSAERLAIHADGKRSRGFPIITIKLPFHLSDASWGGGKEKARPSCSRTGEWSSVPSFATDFLLDLDQVIYITILKLVCEFRHLNP